MWVRQVHCPFCSQVADAMAATQAAIAEACRSSPKGPLGDLLGAVGAALSEGLLALEGPPPWNSRAVAADAFRGILLFSVLSTLSGMIQAASFPLFLGLPLFGTPPPRI